MQFLLSLQGNRIGGLLSLFCIRFLPIFIKNMGGFGTNYIFKTHLSLSEIQLLVYSLLYTVTDAVYVLRDPHSIVRLFEPMFKCV